MDDLKYDVLDGKIDKIDSKIDKILEHSASTDVTLVKQNLEIAHHIARTDLLQDEVSQMKDHAHMIDAIVKVTGAAIGGSGIIFGILKYLKMI